MIDYWKTHNDSFSRVCENLDSWDDFNDFDYSEVFEKLIDDYGKIFNYRYGNAYYELFNDINNINSQNEDEIQDYLDLNLFLEDDYYDYLFVDNNDFFSNDDLDS